MKTVEVKTAIGTKLRATRFERTDVDYIDAKIVFKPGVERLWREWYPDKDWDKEIKTMERWLLTHPPKIYWHVFVNNWMNRAREKTYFYDKKVHEARSEQKITGAPEDILGLADKWRVN